jgi:PHD/YefM family antitoxin component YafN of YafNO toxin-antitoxin module
MSEQILSISDAQKELTRLPDQFEQEPEAITITRYGKPVMAILPFEAYTHLLKTINRLQEEVESLQETLEIVQDEETMEAFRESVEDIKAGRIIPWEEVKKELGWA